MNREILFRGKRVDNGEWAFGAFCPDVLEINSYGKTIAGETLWADGWIRKYCAEERHMKMYEVERDTVGQYTGLTDKNGVKIFEGDIVSAKNNICGETYRFLVEFGVCGGVENVEHSVGFPCFFFKEVTEVIPYEYMMRKDPVYFLNAYKCEVIGNVYDNPELLEGNTQ